ncbi:MAG: hypothetical protein ACR2IJ_08705 [Fluviibacter sp.]
MNAQHTPGPWKVKDKFWIYGPNGLIAETCHADGDPDERESNARLIISAPIMFKAVDALLAAADTSLDYRPEFRLAIANAHAALALATGRNMPLPHDNMTESEGGHHD